MSDVCWLRLDFEDYTTAGPSLTDETSGGVCIDSFTVTVTFKILILYLVPGENHNSSTIPTFILGEYRSKHTCDMWTKYRPTYLCRYWIWQFWHGHYTNEFWNLNYCFSKMGYQGRSNPMRQELCVSLQTCSPQSGIWIKVAINQKSTISVQFISYFEGLTA